jgi:galactitol-specific phosphotransferase system IIC component
MRDNDAKACRVQILASALLIIWISLTVVFMLTGNGAQALGSLTGAVLCCVALALVARRPS